MVRSNVCGLRLRSILTTGRISAHPSIGGITSLLPNSLFKERTSSLISGTVVNYRCSVLEVSRLKDGYLLSGPSLRNRFFGYSRETFKLNRVVCFINRYFPSNFIQSNSLGYFRFVEIVLSFAFHLLLSRRSPVPLMLPS